MAEAKAGILLPEPQHRLQIVRRKSEVDDVLCELHRPCRQLEDVSASSSETSQSLAAVAMLRPWGMMRAGASIRRTTPAPPGQIARQGKTPKLAQAHPHE